jgi:hypothetical protein
MSTRRAFLGLAAGVSAAAAFRDDGLDRVLAASRGAEGLPPEATATDETFWRGIQQTSTRSTSSPKRWSR